jgi:transposase
VSTSILYHGWGLENYRHLKSSFEGGAVSFHIEKKPEKRVCASCRSPAVILEGCITRVWKAVPIGTHPVNLVARLHRQTCAACGKKLLEPLEAADPKKSFTRGLARYVLDLCRKASIADVAELTTLSWDSVCWIVQHDLEGRKKRIEWKHLRYLAIDEVSVGKGQKNYLTVVLDLEAGQAVYVGEGRKKETLAPFFKQLRRSRTKLVAIAMDMHEPFRLAVEEFYRKPVTIVFDHFHIMKLLNAELDEIRRDEVRRLEDKEGRKIIKGSRFLLLRASENLQPDAQLRLQELLAVNKTLSTAYILKEALRNVFRCDSPPEATKALTDWVTQALGSGIQRLAKFAMTLVQHFDGVVAFFEHGISTGPLEAFNNKIQLLKRKAFGYRNRYFLTLRILFLHECKAQVTGA